jgi:hypothetical protein
MQHTFPFGRECGKERKNVRTDDIDNHYHLSWN